MPKKKALNVIIREIVANVDLDCPYCGLENSVELPPDVTKEDEQCIYCQKTFIVELL